MNKTKAFINRVVIGVTLMTLAACALNQQQQDSYNSRAGMMDAQLNEIQKQQPLNDDLKLIRQDFDSQRGYLNQHINDTENSIAGQARVQATCDKDINTMQNLLTRAVTIETQYNKKVADQKAAALAKLEADQKAAALAKLEADQKAAADAKQAAGAAVERYTWSNAGTKEARLTCVNCAATAPAPAAAAPAPAAAAPAPAAAAPAASSPPAVANATSNIPPTPSDEPISSFAAPANNNTQEFQLLNSGQMGVINIGPG